MRIGSIVIHCHDFDRTVAFWQAALHYVPREPAEDRWVVLRDPTGRGPGGSRRRLVLRRAKADAVNRAVRNAGGERP